MKDTVKQIEELLLCGEVENCLSKLRSILSLSGAELTDDVLLIQAEYRKLTGDVRRGLIDYNQETIRQNRINDRILSVLREVGERDVSLNGYERTRQRLLEALRGRGFGKGDWIDEALLARLARLRERNEQEPTRLLWIAKHANNEDRLELALLRELNFEIDIVTTSAEASTLLDGKKPELFVSSIRREGSQTEGLDFLRRYATTRQYPAPCIIYIAQLRPELGVPPYAFGITNHPRELLHLVADILDRK